MSLTSVNRFSMCDTCDKVCADIIEMVTTRPSDRSCLCCVLTTCGHCRPDFDTVTPLDGDSVPGMGTYQQLDDWVNNFGMKNGIYFYE